MAKFQFNPNDVAEGDVLISTYSTGCCFSEDCRYEVLKDDKDGRLYVNTDCGCISHVFDLEYHFILEKKATPW